MKLLTNDLNNLCNNEKYFNFMVKVNILEAILLQYNM
jgi:hypothetical protein